MELTDILNGYLARENITGREFHRRCDGGISYQYIAQILNGKKTDKGRPIRISDDKLSRIAFGMGMSLDELKRLMKNEADRSDKSIELFTPPSAETFNKQISDLIENAIQSRAEEIAKESSQFAQTAEGRIISQGVDSMPEAERKRVVTLLRTIFPDNKYFQEDE